MLSFHKPRRSVGTTGKGVGGLCLELPLAVRTTERCYEGTSVLLQCDVET